MDRKYDASNLKPRAIEALDRLYAKGRVLVSASRPGYRLWLDLEDLGMCRLVDRQVRNHIAYYTALPPEAAPTRP